MATVAGIDTEIFPLTLGANPFGWTADATAAEAILDAFVAAGGNAVDTADSYPQWVPGNTGGESEAIIGNWMADRGNRDRVVVATKVSRKKDRVGLSPGNVSRAVAECLHRLRTDRIDLLYAHYDDEAVPIAEQVRTFSSLVQDGTVSAYALSNYTPARMREFFRTAQDAGVVTPAAIQPNYSLVHRAAVEHGSGPVAAEFGAAIFPYYTLASGFLTGKYRSEADAEGAARAGSVSRYLNEDGFIVIDALTAVADDHGVAPATVALAWLLARGVTAPIASVSRTDQLPALMAAPSLTLTAEQVARLDAASAPFAETT